MSSGTYKNVILVGASGEIGKIILTALLADSTFQISVLSRSESSATFPSNVNVIKVNYSDQDALVKALTNQDIVISAVGGEAILTNFDRKLIEAALKAGVKWFLPSEYGYDFENPSTSSIPINVPLLENIQLLKDNQSKISHTFLTTGSFIDWGLDNSFLGFDISNHKATLYDQGQHPVSGIVLKNLGKAVVTVLRHPELTLNKRIYIVDATFTQKEILTLLEKYTNAKWTVENVTTDDTLKQAEEHWNKGDYMDAYIKFLLGLTYNDKRACEFHAKSHNKALGLDAVPLEQIVQEAVQRKQTATT